MVEYVENLTEVLESLVISSPLLNANETLSNTPKNQKPLKTEGNVFYHQDPGGDCCVINTLKELNLYSSSTGYVLKTERFSDTQKNETGGLKFKTANKNVRMPTVVMSITPLRCLNTDRGSLNSSCSMS